MIFDTSKIHDARDLIKIAAKQFNGYEITPSEIDAIDGFIRDRAIAEAEKEVRTAKRMSKVEAA
jgi:hypothetical protein